MSDTTQAPLLTANDAPHRTYAPAPFPKPGEEVRIVPGVYGAKARVTGDNGTISLFLKGQTLTAQQKAMRNHNSYMNLTCSTSVIEQIEKHWPEFGAMPHDGELHIFRPLLTISFRCKKSIETNALEIVKIDLYDPPFHPRFDTMEKFTEWGDHHSIKWGEARTKFGAKYSEWNTQEVEAWAKQEQAMAKQQTPQAEAPRENLDEWAKRQEADDEPHADRGGHWIDNENTRRHIMAWLNEKMEERQAPKGEWRKEWAAKQCNVATGKIHEYTGNRDDFQKTVWAAIERHDKERMALGKLLLDAKLLRDSVWSDIFGGQATFWDTVASGATLDDIADKVETYIEAAQNAPTTNEKAQTGATTPESQSKSAEPPKNGQEAPKSNPVKTQLNGVKPVEPTTKEDIRDKYTKPISGKDYLQVSGRVLLFRLDHPSWTIETDNVALTDTSAVFKCTIRDDAGRIISTGHGRATEAATKSLGGRFIEKAETAAIGRALALAGFGTDDTLDDVEYPADSPIAA